ncbi:FHA domain-containing protein [Nocardia sp. CA-119907]|uniref:FHA domain-containing protein n=1 Tax=Nocardia sp. CA-119907 TaxID=3239973 RepID=UPI003D98FCC5
MSNPSTVGIAPGDGLIARFGAVVVYLADETPSTDRILGAIEAVADARHPGAAIAQRLAAVVFGGNSEPPPFGVVAPTADGTVILLRGQVTAEIQGAEGTRRLSGARAFTWVDEIIREPVRRITVGADDAFPVHELPRTDLRAGIVPGGGFALHIAARRAGRSAATRGRATGPSPSPGTTPEPPQTAPAGFEALLDPTAKSQLTSKNNRTDAAPTPTTHQPTGFARPAESSVRSAAPHAPTAQAGRAAQPTGSPRSTGISQPPAAPDGPTEKAGPADSAKPTGSGAPRQSSVRPAAPDESTAKAGPTDSAQPTGSARSTGAPRQTSAPHGPTAKAGPADSAQPTGSARSTGAPRQTSAPDGPTEKAESADSAQPAGSAGISRRSSAQSGAPTGKTGPGASAESPVAERAVASAKGRTAESDGSGEVAAPQDVSTQAMSAAERADSGGSRAGTPLRPEPIALHKIPPLQGQRPRPLRPVGGAGNPESPVPVAGALILENGAAYPLDRAYVVGRSPTIDEAVRAATATPITVPRDRHVSRVHAYVSVDRGKVYVRDAATPAGTFIAAPGDDDWTRVGTAPIELPPGWSLRIGQRIITYRTENHPKHPTEATSKGRRS